MSSNKKIPRGLDPPPSQSSNRIDPRRASAKFAGRQKVHVSNKFGFTRYTKKDGENQTGSMEKSSHVSIGTQKNRWDR